ncbi:MAG: DUF2513 domain-containing protein [Pelagimonas sp.]|uniref:DUF2513 domain-containing protein n=1 Tax=Pelagimonas sp. TaxID=2073170 RepID=UPI003D6BD21D
MKRDLGILRKWLFYIEKQGLADNFIEVRLDDSELTFFDSDDKHLIAYNLEQCVLAGLVQSAGSTLVLWDEGEPTIFIRRLTPAGHDYLDAIRANGIWEKTKDTITEAGGSFTLEIVKNLAIGFAKKTLEDKTGLKL